MNSKNIIQWINKPGHFQGMFWTVCSSFFSNLGDVSTRLVGNNLPSLQITFSRLFFGTIILLPLLLYKGKTHFYIKNKSWHLLRIMIGFGAIAFWICGVSKTSLPSITTISFICPILVLPLSYLFLKEKSDWKRAIVVVVAFLGVIIIAFFEKSEITQTSNVLFFHGGTLFLLLGALLFALSDILNKKMVASESLLSLLFYFYLGTALISFIPALLVWKQVTYTQLFYLSLSGISGVSILYCILKAANATEISSIVPYRYVELIFSIVFGYVLFNEVIKISTIIGASLIIPGAIFIAYYEINKEKNSSQKPATKIAV